MKQSSHGFMTRELWLAPLLSVVLSACNAILDIEDAHVDPRLARSTNDAAVGSINTPEDPRSDTDREQDAGTFATHTEDDDADDDADDSDDADDADDAESSDVGTMPDQSPNGSNPDAQIADASTALHEQGEDEHGENDDAEPDEDVDEGEQGQDDATSALDAASEGDDHGHSGTGHKDSGADDHDDDNQADDVDDNAPQDAGPEPTLCEKYCDDITELCTGDVEQYRDRAQCLRVCGLLPQGELGSDANENSAACRLRYAAKARYAAGTELAAYCRQAGPGGDGRCGSNCEGYCSLMMGVCTEADAELYHYEDYDDCVDVCEDLPSNPASYSTWQGSMQHPPARPKIYPAILPAILRPIRTSRMATTYSAGSST